MTYLSDKQLAERFGISRTTVWRWAKSYSRFPKPVSLGPGVTRWRLEDIETWELRFSGGRPKMTTKAEILRAIHQKCIDCSCGQLQEDRLCPVSTCGLYQYRFGADPNPSRSCGFAKSRM